MASTTSGSSHRPPTARRPRARSSCSPRPARSAARRRRSSAATPTAVAAALGEYGATKVYATGDLGGHAARRRRRGGDEGRDRRRRHARPDPVPAELRGPRRRGPPVGQARPHGADEQRRHRRRRRRGARSPRRSSAATRWSPRRSPATGPFLAAFRPKSFAAEAAGGGAAEVVAAPVARPRRRPGGATVDAVHVEESHRAEARRGDHRRVRRPWPRRGRRSTR